VPRRDAVEDDAERRAELVVACRSRLGYGTWGALDGRLVGDQNTVIAANVILVLPLCFVSSVFLP
jgi:hypothetical protein